MKHAKNGTDALYRNILQYITQPTRWIWFDFNDAIVAIVDVKKKELGLNQPQRFAHEMRIA